MNHTYDYFVNKATNYCAKGERCTYDVRENLKKSGANNSDIERIIEYLQEENYLNEQRYATAYTRDKYRFEKWGRIKINYQLSLKKISSSDIEKAFEEIDEEEYFTNLKKLLLSKIKSMKADLNEIAINDETKIYRFCASRGYESNLIKKALHEIKSDI
ncbi:MAG: regulatory protein RecX [Candidatus Aphodosoma sp.]